MTRCLYIRTGRPELVDEAVRRLRREHDEVCMLAHPGPWRGVSTFEWPGGDFSYVVPGRLRHRLRKARFDEVVYHAYHDPCRGYGNVIALAWSLRPKRVRALVWPSGELVDVPYEEALVHLRRCVSAPFVLVGGLGVFLLLRAVARGLVG